MGLFWQKAGFCTGPRLYVVVFAVDDVLWPVIYRRWQFIDVNIDRGGCWGPSDAESWFRAETYNIRILNVSPVFSGVSVFDDEARFCRVSLFCWVSFCWVRCVFAESVVESVICWRGALLLSQFCRVRQTVYWCGHWPPCWGTAWLWVMIQNANVLYTYTKRFTCFCWVSVFDDKARFCRVSFFAESVLLSQTDSLLMWTLTATVAEGPRDA